MPWKLYWLLFVMKVMSWLQTAYILYDIYLASWFKTKTSDKVLRVNTRCHLAPYYPDVVTIDCKALCLTSNSLPWAPRLRTLNCPGSLLLTAIHGYSKLTHLDCNGCISLKSIRRLPELTHLQAQGTAIEELSNLPLLQHARVGACNKLRRFHRLPSLERLDISEIKHQDSINISQCSSLSVIMTGDSEGELYLSHLPALRMVVTRRSLTWDEELNARYAKKTTNSKGQTLYFCNE